MSPRSATPVVLLSSLTLLLLLLLLLLLASPPVTAHASHHRLLPPAAVSGPAAPQAAGASCADVHVLLWRGNNEAYPGRQGKLVRAIQAALGGEAPAAAPFALPPASSSPSQPAPPRPLPRNLTCDYEDVVFDNARDAEYCGAVEAGRDAGRAQLAAYAARCPAARLVLAGYSQGAHALGDALGGTPAAAEPLVRGCRVSPRAGLDPAAAPGNRIAAALLFGDVRHAAGQPYDALAAARAHDGAFPRRGAALAGLNRFAPALRAWCEPADPVCAPGGPPHALRAQDHLGYFDRYADEAAAWVRDRLRGAAPATSGPAPERPRVAVAGSAGVLAGWLVWALVGWA
ncbi:Alpha/Beta hydrolase protein [Durotheca rogersii]|uniref:Alpha/Beta hydrolase protein n=1 Tax=Durotheca rogersii TaxID=419775 RepID=UPI00221F8D85|nr:Alpha/Beta hydrolase protein [Durotheca rogersii]KAI5863870.1 Alpha/Beta hydrolase protein [Durotheca rogersii]